MTPAAPAVSGHAYAGAMVNYRYLGNSGLKVSEITYGNWVTHASQVEDAAAVKTVHAALDAGITTFDTADTYANTAAEVVLGKALEGQRRESLEIFTKVYFPTGPKGPNDTGLSRKHILESINGSLQRLGTDYVDLYQAHRFDYETPLEETFQAFADVVRQGKALYIGVSEWTAEQLREGHALATQLGVQLISNQPQYSMLHRVIEGKVVPASEELGISQIVWSPMAQGVLSGKYLPGQPVPEGSRATDPHSGAHFIQRFLQDDILTAVQRLKPIAAQAGLTMPQLAIAWVLQNKNVAAALVGASRPEQLADTVKASGVVLDADTLAAIDDALAGVVNDDPQDTYDVSPKERLA
ncbi:Predicted oxidoreductase [Microbacterium azadirachtae]|uniref:Predicted oxidoreductase n=2 Tax=Microbacterium azadirachtae TaxID=582680 RepID=A0A1I6I578_9MICO|nr:Predicted oxidoreductase [Microbacterium azadirachtae]